MNGAMSRVGMVLLVLLALLIGLAGGAILDRQVLAAPLSSGSSANAGLDVRLINEAYNAIKQHYVEPSATKAQQLTYGAISGMVDSLGDTGHSTFLTPAELQQEHNYEQGQFEGIGAEVQIKDGHVIIVAPMDGSPALKAGIKPGTVILKVNGKDVTGEPLDQVASEVSGPAGTRVTLTLMDPPNGPTHDVTITRARIDVPSVTWQMLPGTTIMHIRLSAFSDGVTKSLQQALAAARSQGATGIIFDLRNNPGGLLSEAVGVTSQFLSSGNVLQEKDAQGNIKPVPVQSGQPVTSLPMVVLVNNGTGSAAEIVSGALQDAKRGTLIGETTFGTGTVLLEFKLSDGSALLLATEEWLTPKGRVIWHQGITPDVTVTLDPSTILMTPDGEKGLTLDQIQKSGDTQLNKAIDQLSATH